MRVIKSVLELKTYLSGLRKSVSNFTVGFVPTMGALHQGHISLIEQCRRDCNLTVCSIFVNPIQFNNLSDLEKYPRTPEKDIDLLEKSGCDVLFMPDNKEMYPEKINTIYDLNGFDTIMEGKFRPGHFNGVAIVVKRLIDIVNPDKAYFGEKDFQQLAIIKLLVKKLNLPVEIVSCKTVREPDGLAMSSRNVRLSDEQRKNAPVIYQCLCYAKEHIHDVEMEDIKKYVNSKINSTPEMQLEYFEIVDSNDLSAVHSSRSLQKETLTACIAVYLGNVRLIDNIKI